VPSPLQTTTPAEQLPSVSPSSVAPPSLVASLTRESDAYTKIPVGNQRDDEAAMHSLPARFEGTWPCQMIVWGAIA
jgi:hypothetical protein